MNISLFNYEIKRNNYSLLRVGKSDEIVEILWDLVFNFQISSEIY